MDFKNNGDKVIEKFNEIQAEILRIGWKGILESYHPDSNFENPDAFKIFQLYKEIYENMHKRLIIDEDTPGVTQIQNSSKRNENAN
jgi:hypothetical protein